MTTEERTDQTPGSAPESRNWTSRTREALQRIVPPGQLLPDRQPVYVASWMYVFGVLTAAALLVVIASGVVLAIGGAAWWHVSTLGHFVNSTHLWSVELFFAFMVVHLWGQFWMAAWRGRRALTWITGTLCFVGSIGAAFTGYLSQSNFDSQWISTQAKDGLNAVGFGAWFNVLNPGQMLMWHIVLMPGVVGLIVGVHLVLVRRHGVVPPIEVTGRGTGATDYHTNRLFRPGRPLPRESSDFPTRGYDLVKEFTLGLVFVTALTLGLAGVFSSPDVRPITMSRWAQAAPSDVVATAASELAGTSTSAGYGPPYNHAAPGGSVLGVPLAKWGGVRLPVDSAALVLDPLCGVQGSPTLSKALATWDAASPTQQTAWATAYANALASAPSAAQVAPGNYGPVPVLAGAFLTLARSGGLEGALTSSGDFYGGDQTRSLLLLADGAYLEDQARALKLGGDQWGMMNETGNYPGQPWMWLYTFWYQVKPFSTSDNADAEVWALMMALTLGLVLVPFIPGVRDIPRLLPLHRLIWRDYYRRYAPGEHPEDTVAD